CRRRPTAAALIAVTASVLLTAGIVGPVVALHELGLREEADRQRQRAEEKEQQAMAAQAAEEKARLQAEDNERKAIAAGAGEKRERRHAEAEFAEARRAVRFITEIGRHRLANEPQLVAVRNDILKTALSFHQQFLERNANKQNVRYQLALAHLRV